MIQLKKVVQDNLRKIVCLSVEEEQKGFVASNTESILEAYVTITAGNVALPFGIYQDDTLVGFVMFGYGSEEGDPEFTKDSYCIWRFMIDAEYQGKGLGKAALMECICYLKTCPCGPANSIWLSYEPHNQRAAALYRKAGFCETGEICEGEAVAILKF